MRNDRLRSTHFAAKFLSSAGQNVLQTRGDQHEPRICQWDEFSRCGPAEWRLDAGIGVFIDGLVTWQRRHKDRMHLMALDDRLLHDIGISAADVEHEVSKPFWKP